MKKKILLYCFKKHFAFAAKHPNLWNYRPIASYLGRMKTFVLSQCKSDFVKLDKISMTLPENEFLHLVLFEHEGLVSKIAKNLVKKENNVLGANIGYWTCFLAQIIGNSGKVYAFEPSPENFEYLEKNVSNNNFKNIILEKKAVADKSYQTKLYLSNGTMDNRIYDPNLNRESIKIDVIKLDEYFKNSNLKLDYIQSNIQGADFAAILGMKELLKKSPNLKLMIEFAPKMAKEYGTDPNSFIDLLSSENFKFYEVWWYAKKAKLITSEKLKDYVKNNYVLEKIYNLIKHAFSNYSS